MIFKKEALTLCGFAEPAEKKCFILENAVELIARANEGKCIAYFENVKKLIRMI